MLQAALFDIDCNGTGIISLNVNCRRGVQRKEQLVDSICNGLSIIHRCTQEIISTFNIRNIIFDIHVYPGIGGEVQSSN